MPIGTPRATPYIQPQQAENLPVQAPDAYGIEWKDSRSQAEDLQRESFIYVYIVRGRPDQAAIDQAIGGLRLGYPHGWKPHTYVIHVRFEHHLAGPDPNSANNTPTAQRDSKALTKMTVTYRQMPCPGKWEEDDSVSLVSRQEWYDRLDPPRALMNTRQGVSILIPVPVHKRHYPKVFLTPTQKLKIEKTIGKRNGEEGGWKGREVGFWLLEGWRTRLLYGDPYDGIAAWEITLIYRGDPERLHNWWWPVTTVNYLPLPGPGTGQTRAQFFEDAFEKRQLYGLYEESFDDLVPLRGTPCDPADTT